MLLASGIRRRTLVIDVHHAGAAQACAAAEFGASELQIFADHPPQRSLWRRISCRRLTVHKKTNGRCILLGAARTQGRDGPAQSSCPQAGVAMAGHGFLVWGFAVFFRSMDFWPCNLSHDGDAPEVSWVIRGVASRPASSRLQEAWLKSLTQKESAALMRGSANDDEWGHGLRPMRSWHAGSSRKLSPIEVGR